MNIIESLEWRYACKKFDTSKKLTETQIETLKKAFNLTPTSFGLQPVKMIIIKDQELKDQIFPLAYYQEQVKTCSHLFIICMETVVDENTIDHYFDYEKKVRGTSEEVVGTFRKQLKEMYSKMPKEDIERSSVHQTYIVLGNLMTVCAVEGIDNCPMEGFIPSKIDDLLALKDKNLKSVLMLPVGYRAEDDIMIGMKKVRKPLDDIIIEM